MERALSEPKDHAPQALEMPLCFLERISRVNDVRRQQATLVRPAVARLTSPKKWPHDPGSANGRQVNPKNTKSAKVKFPKTDGKTTLCGSGSEEITTRWTTEC